MTGWKALAQARSLKIPDADLDRIVPVLEALETAFAPLALDLPPELDPSPSFDACEESA
jgi:hypothetical protein